MGNSLSKFFSCSTEEEHKSMEIYPSPPDNKVINLIRKEIILDNKVNQVNLRLVRTKIFNRKVRQNIINQGFSPKSPSNKTNIVFSRRRSI